MMKREPFVSVVTPVFNGEKYISECIESVLRQKYGNWEYVIVNNCSTDSTSEIIARYAKADHRVRVIHNSGFVGAVENHNIAVSNMSPESKYCKIISADDYIYPQCISHMVEVAEEYPSVGIVGSYQQSGDKVICQGLPISKNFFKGSEVCRSAFLDNLRVFGDPTSSLYRSDLVRQNRPFFPHTRPHADTSACYKYLQIWDFGFVHEILSVERVHMEQRSKRMRDLHASSVVIIELLRDYGPECLTKREFEFAMNVYMDKYYRGLGKAMLKISGREYWEFHLSRMRELGFPVKWRKVVKGALLEILNEFKDPRLAIVKVLKALRKKRPDLLKKCLF